jgi:hypothetical protein
MLNDVHYNLSCHCPQCQSTDTASRRQLFRQIVADESMDQAFSWYGEHSPRAFPPKSFFVVLLLLVTVCVPLLFLWLPEGYAVPALIEVGLAALLAALVADLLLTYRRYKVWAKQWLCGHCKKAYFPDLI